MSSDNKPMGLFVTLRDEQPVDFERCLQASMVAAASPCFHQFIQSQANSIFGKNGQTASFQPAKAPAINFHLTPEQSWTTQIEMFIAWLAEASQYPNGAIVTADEAKQFFSDFVRAAMNIKTSGGISSRTKRLVSRIASMTYGYGGFDPQRLEAMVTEEMSGVALDICMDASTLPSPTKDKTLLMRTAAASVIQERIDVQQSYANRSPEHKDRLTILEALKQKIEGIDPGGLE